MKRLEDFRPNKHKGIELKEDVTDLPDVLVLKRKSVHLLPEGIQVATYYSTKLNKYVTIPLKEAVELKEPKPFTDKNLEILKNIVVRHKAGTLKFSDNSSLDIDVDVANAILSIYTRCDDNNKKKIEDYLTKGSGGVMKLIKFAMQNC